MEFSKTLLYIDSKDRNSGEINDFTVNLGNLRSNIAYIQIHSVEMVNCIYPIRSNYNSIFKFKDTSNTLRSITLDDGNYDIDTLLDTLTTKMNVYSGTYSLSYSNINYKITITGDNDFEIITSDNENTIWDILGFKQDTDLTGSSSYTASHIFNLSQEPSYIYIKSSLIQGSKDKIMTANNDKRKSYLCSLCKIPLDAQFGELIHYKPNLDLKFETEERTMNTIRFWLEDRNGNLLPMDREWSLSLILYMYNSNDLNFYGYNRDG